MERHFVASVVIVRDNKVLLIFHRKHQKWLPPGGHLEANETPAETAIREAFEETGLHIELLQQENIWVSEPHCKSFERPYMCLLENIPAHKEQPAHQHMDMLYIGRPQGGVERENVEETDGLKWFSLDELETLRPGVDIFTEVLQLLRHIAFSERLIESR